MYTISVKHLAVDWILYSKIFLYHTIYIVQNIE